MTTDLPPGWENPEIGEILQSLEDGRTIHQGWSPQCEKDPSSSDAEWGVLKTTAIQAGVFLPQHNKRLPVTLEPRPHLEVKSGDLLLTSAGPRSRCGVACIVNNTRPKLMISGKMYRFRFDEDSVLPGYIEAYLQSHRARLDIDKMKTGVSDSGLNLTQNRFRRLKIPLAPVTEQRRIVAAIEEHLSRLDAIESSLQSGLTSVVALRLSILRKAFHIDQELPDKWARKRMDEIADVQLGRQRSPQYHSGPHMRPYLRAANVTWGGINLDDVKEMNFDTSDFETFRLHPGDLLLNEASGSPNEVGKPAVWWGEIEDCCFQNTLLRLQARDIDSDYLYWYCYMAALTGRFGEAGRGVNIRHLGKQGLARFPIAIAPRAEQRDIVTRLQEQFQQSSECETSVRQALERARALRRSILTKAFAGQLVPQSPESEPSVVPWVDP